MNESEYLALFRDLALDTPVKRALLKHAKGLPKIYFNVKRDGSVYFAVRSEHYAAFSDALWRVTGPQQKKDDKPDRKSVV